MQPDSATKCKFGQVIEHNIRNIFLKTYTQNVAGKQFPDPFLKDQNSTYLWISRLKFYTVCLPSFGLSKYIETKLQTTSFHLISNFLKLERCLELVFLSHLLHDFRRKDFLVLYSINWSNPIVWLSLLREICLYFCLYVFTSSFLGLISVVRVNE